MELQTEFVGRASVVAINMELLTEFVRRVVAINMELLTEFRVLFTLKCPNPSPPTAWVVSLESSGLCKN